VVTTAGDMRHPIEFHSSGQPSITFKVLKVLKAAESGGKCAEAHFWKPSAYFWKQK